MSGRHPRRTSRVTPCHSSGRTWSSSTLALGALVGMFAAVSPSSAIFACDPLDIAAMGIERCVVPGDQAEIDAGNVVRVDRLSTPTVHWLAGHRTSHGATFRDLTGLEIGDRVTFRDTDYEIAEYRLVNRFEPGDVVDWPRAPEPSVVLQTSHTDTYVHVWRATAVARIAPTPRPAPDPAPRVEPPRRVGPGQVEHRGDVTATRFPLASLATARAISDHVERARSAVPMPTAAPHQPRTTIGEHVPRPTQRRPA